MIRAFIALSPSKMLQQTLAEAQATLQKFALPFRWVPSAHVHLTLKFLGDIAVETVDPIADAMRRAITSLPPFTMSVRGLGCFPSPARPRVLCMEVHAPPETLFPMHQRLDAELTPLGLPPETRPFRPHLTLGRAQQRINSRQLATVLHTYHDRHFGDMVVEHMTLFQSQLHRDGAVYTMLHSVPLQQ